MNKAEHPRFGFWFGVAIFSATFLVFCGTLSNGFVRWDDYFHIVQNPDIQGLDWPHLRKIFTTFPRGTYIPLSHLSMAIDHTIWGLSPAGFHLTALLIHGANSILLFLLAGKLIRMASNRSGPEHAAASRSIDMSAAVAALLFAIHPLRVESVAWATERRDVLSGFFTILFSLAYIRYAESRKRPTRYRWGYLIATLLFVCALLSKATVVTLPVVCLLLDAGVLHRFRLAHWRNERSEIASAVGEKIPWFFMSLIVGAGTVYGLYCGDLGDTPRNLQQYAWTSRLAQSLAGNAHYLSKMTAPSALNPLYKFVWFDGMSPLVWEGLVLTVVLSGAALMVYRSHPSIATAWFSYLIMIAPMLGIAQNGPQFAADRYTYLPCIPLCILAGGVGHYLWERDLATVKFPPMQWLRLNRTPAALQWAIPFLAVGLLVGLGALTWRQVRIWRDSESLWRHSARLDPESHLAWANLGFALAEKGAHAEALTAYRRALELAPEAPTVWYNAGRSLEQIRRPRAAVEAYRRELALNPTDPDAHGNVGRLLIMLKDPRSGLRHLETADKLAPSSLTAYNLGCCHELLGHRAEALRYLQFAAHAGLPEAWIEWSEFCLRQGKPQEALTVLRKGVQQKMDLRLLTTYAEMVLKQSPPSGSDLALARQLLDQMDRATDGPSEPIRRLRSRLSTVPVSNR